MTETFRRFLHALLARFDAWLDRIYGWRLNPLYHSGAVTVALLLVLLLTGLYLLIFYRLGSPYASVGRVTDQIWAGRWIRTLHRYSSDAAVVAIMVHGLRMFLQHRTWGARTLAWLSGVVLLFVFLVCGWTGYVMVWDVQAQVIAREGARWLDWLPIFSEPIGRAFSGEGPMPGAFFFLNLFLHIALPIGLAVLLWIHTSRVARAVLMPPRILTYALLGGLTALSLVVPVRMAGPADLLRVPEQFPLDVFDHFWPPLTQYLPAGAVWGLAGLLGVVLLAVPWIQRPQAELVPDASVVVERSCTGCEQCYVDCPYEAIDMIVRTDGRAGLVARVTPELCVSCGICAGSCAPMGVGPPMRTGRDQVAQVREFIAERGPGPTDVVLIACGRGAGGAGRGPTFDGAPVMSVPCAGSLHTSVIEFLVRSGAGGVMVVSCQPRDCWSREGPRWLEERMYEDREAELQPRVDRERVELVYAGAAEADIVRAELEQFRVQIRALDLAPAEADVTIDAECVVPEEAPELEAAL